MGDVIDLGESSRRFVTAHLQSVDQPLVGFNMTVTASIRYMVTERATGKEIFSRVVSVPYTASFGDSLMGVERLRLANEGAIRSNISQLIDELMMLKVESVTLK